MMKVEDAAAALEASLADEVARHDAAARQARAKLAEAAEARARLTTLSAADAQSAMLAARRAAAPGAWRAYLAHLAHEERLIERAEALASDLAELEASIAGSQAARHAAGVGHPKAGIFLRGQVRELLFAARRRRLSLAKARAEALQALAEAEAAASA